MKTLECAKCKTKIRPCNFQKHVQKCDGEYKPFKKATNCPYCDVDLSQIQIQSANHIRWCEKNPKRSDYISKAQNTDRMRTPEAIQKRTIGMKKAHADGKYSHLDYSWNIGRKHTEESKEKLREKALASKHRRLVRSIQNYQKKDGSIVKLESSWEVVLAKRLDELNIEWIRPEPVPWQDKEGRTHNYFPDFYLPDYDLFLDPKNAYARASQKEKLEILTATMKNLIIIKTLEECQTFTI